MANGFPAHLRTARIIQEIIAPLLTSLVSAGLITVCAVEVSVDRRHATIQYTVMGADPAETHKLLLKELGYLRGKLAQDMQSRRVPQLALLQLPLEMPNPSCTVS